MRKGSLGVGAAVALLAGMLAAPVVNAATPAAALTISAVAGPTIFSPEHDSGPFLDSYTVTVTNSGSRPTDGSTITISDLLPVGLTSSKLIGRENRPSGNELTCDTPTVTCTYSAPLQPGEGLIVMVFVTVASGTAGPVTDTATVSGGGAPTASVNEQTAIGSAALSKATPFGVAFDSQQATGIDGLADEQAGDHPFEQTLSYSMNTINMLELSGVSYQSAGGLHGLPAHTKDVIVDLPPGVVGNPDAIERCPQYKVATVQCPPNTQIGTISLNLNRRQTNSCCIALEHDPIYNVVPDRHYPAEFVAAIEGAIPAAIYASVNPETNYGVRLITPSIPEIGSPQDVSVTFFGTPLTDPNLYNKGAGTGTGKTPVAFLANPTDCSLAPQTTKVYMDSWEYPAAWLPDGQPDLKDPNWVSASTTLFPSLTGCDLLQFDPSILVTPDTTQADEPAGVNVHLTVPQAPQLSPALVTPGLKDATVTLPAGLSVSPSAADGLQGCSDAQFAPSSDSVASCPLASQIATVTITTPLLEKSLEGQVFLGTPHCDPCSNADAADGNMFRLFLQAQGSGVLIKTQGTTYVNTATGQLTTTFKNNPQEPFSDLELHFNSGLRAPLAMPQSCGKFTTTSDLVPWSTPATADATPSSPFTIDWDGNGGACPATIPFAPSFNAGTSNPNASQLSPLTVTFARNDREQDLAGIQVKTPPGLLGTLSSVPLCGEPQADLGTCSAASRIGTITVAAGPGSHPFYEQGSLYLTGPYKGAPFGLSIVVPTIAGPFDLGNVIVRAQIDIDLHTAALTVTSDPLPQIIDGIPLRLRTANVTVDRPGFIFNPSNCAQLHITATLSGAQGAQARELVPFAVSGCAGLSFDPKFSVSTSGRTSRKNGASLDAKLVWPNGAQSNIAKVKVDLPRQLPSRLTTLQNACPDSVFNINPAICPKGSLIGVVKAVTPILPVPLVGPAYFVSHGGTKFPDLVAILQGYGVRVDLVGETFISKKGITSSTFHSVPDVPVSSFELTLPEGLHSALAANGNLCKDELTMPTSFIAQDGAQLKQSTPIKVTGCVKATKASRARRASRARAAGDRHGGQGGGK